MDPIKLYLIEVFWSVEDESFIAVAPDLPGCNASGETVSETLREMEDAMQSWLQACQAVGRSLPIPITKARYAA